MASSNTAGAPDPKKDFDISNISDPAKVLHDYLYGNEKCDENDRPKILDALFNTMKYPGIDTEEFRRIMDKILTFDPETNELNHWKIQQITEGIQTLKENELSKRLSKKRIEALPKIEIAFKESSERFSQIQSEIEEFKYKVLPEVVIEIKAAADNGLLFTEALLCKPYDMIEKCIQLSNERIVILKQIDKFKSSIDYLILYTTDLTDKVLEVENRRSKSSKPEIKHKKKTTQNKNVNLEKAYDESKKGICRLEHNTPFCNNCGWLTSWLKNFKKRGVYIKEADNSVSKHIWYNNVNNA